jgi:HAD superfamily hydrolase (TIGR01509 family)
MARARVKIDTVLLDVDGTLVDSNDLHAQAWREVFLDFGFDVPYARLRNLIGMGGDRLVPAATGQPADDPRWPVLVEQRTRVFLERYLPHVRAFPHARDFLARLGEEGYRRVVATSGRPEEFRPILERAGLADLIDAAASAGDAPRSKPAPDIVTAALQLAGSAPAAAIMIGDSPYDVEAGTAAGVPVIALRCGGFSDRDLRHALAVFDSPMDLLERFASSPLTRLPGMPYN